MHKHLFEKLIYNFNEKSAKQIIDNRRRGFILLVGMISIITLAIMGTVSFFEGENVLFLVDFTVMTLLTVIIYLYFKFRKIELGANVITAFIGVFFIFLFIYGGHHGYAYVWLYLFPFIAMFLLDPYRGLIYSFGLFGVCIVYFLLPDKSGLLMNYSPDFALRFGASFFILILLTYFSEVSIMKALDTIADKNSELSKQLAKLNDVNNDLNMYKNNLEVLVKEKTKSLELYSKIFNEIKELLIITDNEGVIADVNEYFLNTVDMTKEDLIGNNINSLNIFNIHPEQYKEIISSLKENDFWTGEFEFSLKKDKPVTLKLNVSTVKENGDIKYFILTFHDISRYKFAEQILYKKALYDNLTKLPNQNYCFKEIKGMINLSIRKNTKFAVLFLDIDDFKFINDKRGREFGDKLLIIVAERLRYVLRDSDVICRLRGDKFLISLDFKENIRYLHTICRRVLDILEEPFEIDNTEEYIGASIGIAIFPNNGTRVETLVNNADIAMFKAKVKGKKTYCFFKDEDQIEVNKRIDIENTVSEAIDNDNLFLEYQQIFDNRILKVAGYEALVRIKNGHEVIYPDDFIPFIEGTSVIVKLTNRVIKMVCEDIQKFRKIHDEKIFISVNIPEEYLIWEESYDYLKNMFKKYNISEGEIEFEIKDSSAFQYAPQIFKKLLKYRNLGVSLTVDDFGKGFLSLKNLKDLKINKIKIDKIFIDDLETKSNDKSFHKLVIDIANNLDIVAVAEGVEKESQAEILNEMKCHYLQGYLLNKPKRVEEYIKTATG